MSDNNEYTSRPHSTVPSEHTVHRTGTMNRSSVSGAKAPHTKSSSEHSTSSVRRSASSRPSASRNVRRPVSSSFARSNSARQSSVRKKTAYRWNKDAIITLALIVVLALAIIGLLIWVISSCSSGCSDSDNVHIYGPADGVAAIIYKEGSRTQSLETTDIPSETQTAAAASQNDLNTPEVSETPIANVPVVTSAPVNKNSSLRSCRIRTVGDFVIDTSVYDSARAYSKQIGSSIKYDFSGMLYLVKDIMADADWTVANVDGCMRDNYKYGYSGYPQFNTPTDLMFALKDAGVDMLTCANNHMLDGWFDGLCLELDNIEAKGLVHIGASRTREERDTPTVIEINGIKIGFLNYTHSLNDFENRAVDKKALDFGCHWTKNSDVSKDARMLRAAGAEIIVCYMHWGTEYETNPDANQKKYANDLVKAGVDVIVGGHPHVVQKAEWLTGTNQFGEQQKTLCVYSLGNYLSNHYKIKGTEGGIIFDFTIQEKADGSFDIVNASYIPTYVMTTGSDSSGYSYTIVPCTYYINHGTRPSGMDNSSYNKMVSSYNYQVSIMSDGVGSLKDR